MAFVLAGELPYLGMYSTIKFKVETITLLLENAPHAVVYD